MPKLGSMATIQKHSISSCIHRCSPFSDQRDEMSLCRRGLSVVSLNTDRGGAGIISVVLRRQSVEAHEKTPYKLPATRARLLEARTAGRALNLLAIPIKQAAHLISSGCISANSSHIRAPGFVASSHTPHGASITSTCPNPCTPRTIHMGSIRCSARDPSQPPTSLGAISPAFAHVQRKLA